MKRLLALVAILSLALVACDGDPTSDTVVPGSPASVDEAEQNARDAADEKEDELEERADEVEASFRAID